MQNILDRGANDNRPDDEPTWFVLHGGCGCQRRRYGPDMQRLADDLKAYGWLVWRAGCDLIARHPATISEDVGN